MSWDDINKAKELKSDQGQIERARELAKSFSRTFESVEGKKVLEDLTQAFLMNNSTQLNAQNVNYEAAYHNGETGVIKYIIHKINQAKEL